MKKQMVGSSLLIAFGMLIGVLLISNFSPSSIGDIFASTKKFGADSPPVVQSEAMRTLNKAFTSASEAVLPSVVSIEVTSTRKSPKMQEFFEFFRPRGGQDEEESLVKGNGSGVFISVDGYIVTNNHVVEDAKDIKVTTYDKRNYKATLVGADPLTDLAVIKIEGEGDFPAVHFADINSVKVGEWVMAVGNPLGLTSTVTTGIVSAIGRGHLGMSRNSYSVEYYIQTDAAINPGNSGGGLFDMNGSLTGINTAIATSTGNYIGYGFAIPVDLVKSVIDDLIDDGEINRGYIGVSINSVRDEVEAKALGLDGVYGVVVGSILNGSAAEDAGIEAGDVILELDGEKLYSSGELQSRIAQKRAGDKVDVLILRNGKKIKKVVKLRARDEDNKGFAENKNDDAETGVGKNSPINFEKLGFKVEKLTDKIKKEYNTENGVLITEVKRFSAASDRGMFPNGVIVEADRKKVNSTRELKDIIDEKKPGEAMLLQVKYPEVTRILAIQIPESEG
ncbi:MAG: Do family serine endopeptidase [Candidatus Kapaibacterium sp.]